MDNFLWEPCSRDRLGNVVRVLQLLRNPARRAYPGGALWRGVSRIQETSPALVWKDSTLIFRGRSLDRPLCNLKESGHNACSANSDSRCNQATQGTSQSKTEKERS